MAPVLQSVAAVLMMVMLVVTTAPSTGHYSPVSASECGVTQSVQDRVDRAVDVAQPVACR